jgi:hypothetical protein
MTREIPPLPPHPDEAAREFVRETIVAAEAEGRPERAFYIARDALYEAWREIDRVRAAMSGEATGDDGETLGSQ